MSRDIIGAVLVAITGVFVAFINYCISKKVLIKAPERFSAITVVRQFLQVGFLAVVYLIGSNIESVNTVYLLVGAVLGMTLPMFYFTKKLLSVNELRSKNKKEEEGETDG